jgi:glycosyltransferase involved in cell wall biosynthesis
MNIALITQSFLPDVGGVEWKVHYLATEYAARGHEVTVFACKPKRKYKNMPLSITFDYPVVRCCYEFPGNSLIGMDRLQYLRAILRHHRQRPFDILHCHPLGYSTLYGVDVKKKTGVPVVATTCGADVQIMPELHYGDRLNPRYDRIVRKTLQAIDVVGSISRSVRDAIESMHPAAEIVDIPNGVDWAGFQREKSTLLHERLGISRDAIVIISVGRNHIKKGYAYGIKAFASIAERFKNAYYVIAGAGASLLAPAVNEAHVNEQVRLVEQVPMSEMPSLYHSADIFFNPSLVEGFAQVNAQALASGLPCVLTDAPGNCDAGDYGGALIARSADSTSMADMLQMLIEDSALKERLAREAHAASKRYSWETIAREYLNIFERLMIARKQSPG